MYVSWVAAELVFFFGVQNAAVQRFVKTFALSVVRCAFLVLPISHQLHADFTENRNVAAGVMSINARPCIQKTHLVVLRSDSGRSHVSIASVAKYWLVSFVAVDGRFVLCCERLWATLPH